MSMAGVHAHSILPRPPAPAERWHDLEESLGANFRRIARAFGQRPALAAGSWDATYEQLAGAAERVARAIEAVSRGPVDADMPPRAALLMRHDTPLFAAVLGALGAGHVVVALNRTDPPARLEQVIAEARPSVMLVDHANREVASRIAPLDCAIVEVDVSLFEGAGPSEGAMPTAPGPRATGSDRPAFIIYTSGSTGRPKGVIQTHRNLLHNVRRLSRGMRISEADRVALLSAISGGQGIATMLLTLFNGATLLPFATMEKGVLGLDDWLDGQAISIWVSAASLFRNFAKVLDSERRFVALRVLRLGSEAITAADFTAFKRHTGAACVFMPTLSSTETGNTTQHFLTHADVLSGEAVPVGEAVEDVEILLLDEAGAAVKVGEIGEIAVRGRYLSPGYWGEAALTAERFSEAGDGRRLYRGGDMGRRTAEGLFHVGRADAQVKIRGYRIETAEVRRALERHPAVEQAAVWADVDAATGANDALQLHACVVLRHAAAVRVGALRAALLEALPSYMAPASIVVVGELPLNAHGKVDLEKLRAMPVPAADADDPPATPTEAVLAELWGAIFKGVTIGRRADFFALGGDSLSAAVVAARLHAARGVALTLQAFAEHPTLAGLAAHVDALALGPVDAAAAMAPVVRVGREAGIPLSYTQERIWRICQGRKDLNGYTMTCAYQITGPLEVERFLACVNFLVRRHEILRTTFHGASGRAGEATQRVQAAEPWKVPMLDFSGLADAQRAAQAFLAAEAAEGFDLSRLPLVRMSLARVSATEHYLLRVSHHIISDSWSWRLFFTELGALYEASQEGKPVPFAEVAPLGYADYAAWQRRTLRRDGPAYQASVDWWAAAFTPPPPALLLPFARRKPLRQADMSQGVIPFSLEPEFLARLDARARAGCVTAFMMRLAALATLLSRRTGQRDLVLGTYATNRQRIETQQMFGDFSNLATLRVAVDPAAPFERILQTVRGVVIGAQANSEIPYEQLGGELRARRPSVAMPEIRAIVALSDRISGLRFGGLEVSWLDRAERAPWGFTLALDGSTRKNQCRATFDPRLHDPAGVRAFVGDYVRLLDEAAR